MGTLKKLAYPVPPIEEQKEVVLVVEESLSLLNGFEYSLDVIASKLVDLDQSILSKAFRGELVPQDPKDEPAADLLARIRATREAAEAKKKTTRKKKAKKKATRR